jgi:creatinine amidohydrolase/Fe(II)-dependent formamide hydrolase-like protein
MERLDHLAEMAARLQRRGLDFAHAALTRIRSFQPREAWTRLRTSQQGRFSLPKIAVSTLAGLAIAVFAVSRPLTAPLPSTLDMTDMTWVEVRSAIENGYTTVIVPSGGIEQNGPHMVLGKHDYIVRFTADRIASELGNTLVAPVVSFVPQGDYAPPTSNMRFPGTIGVPPKVFADMLEGIARSLKNSGFTTICFIADHGLSQAPQNEVATRLNREWAKDGVTVLSVSDYYADEPQTQYLLNHGETPTTIGDHAGIPDTSELMAVHPEGVNLARFSQRPFTFAASGVSGDPMKASAERGNDLLQIKIDAAVRQIRASQKTQ